jgi:transketolase
MNSGELHKLKLLSAKIRLNILKMLVKCTYGHLGGSMSVVEALSVLYGGQMRYDVKRPDWAERDYLVLSKGHAGPALYSALAAVGFIDEEELYTLNQNGTNLPSHPDRRRTRGVDATTGSLAQGTSVAAGIGYGFRLRGTPQCVYLVVGDGELNEGQCWEAFQFIAAHRLSNVVTLIDENKRQLDGYTKDILYPFDIASKMRAFGFNVLKAKGDDEGAISDAIDEVKRAPASASCIVLDTIKGQGVRYFEEMRDNHSVKFKGPDHEAARVAIEKLEAFLRGTEV